MEEVLSIFIRGIVAVLGVCEYLSEVIALIDESPALKHAVKDCAGFLFRCIDRMYW